MVPSRLRPKPTMGTFGAELCLSAAAQNVPVNRLLNRTNEMMNLEAETSQALVARLAELQAKMRAARITQAEMKTFQNLAAIMEEGRGQIAGDDLIAASFLVESESLNG